MKPGQIHTAGPLRLNRTGRAQRRYSAATWLYEADDEGLVVAEYHVRVIRPTPNAAMAALPACIDFIRGMSDSPDAEVAEHRPRSWEGGE